MSRHCGGRAADQSTPRFPDWRRGGPRGSCQGILGWVNGFATCRKRLVQANACSGRPPRAPAMERAAGGPAHHGRSCGRSREGVPPRRNSLAIVNSPLHEGSPLCNWVRALVGALIIPDAVRRAGPTGASGKEWTLFAPRCAAFLSIERERRAAGGARASHLVRRVCDPNPITHCARTCCSPARRRGSPRLGCLSFGSSRGGCRAGVARSVALRVPRSVRAAARAGLGARQATWLILPVVICLSQRLSHACLSISDYTVKLRMAH